MIAKYLFDVFILRHSNENTNLRIVELGPKWCGSANEIPRIDYRQMLLFVMLINYLPK